MLRGWLANLISIFTGERQETSEILYSLIIMQTDVANWRGRKQRADTFFDGWQVRRIAQLGTLAPAIGRKRNQQK